MSTIPIVCVVGRSGVGKTTLLEKLIPELKRRGYRVATIKHHGHLPESMPQGQVPESAPPGQAGIEIDRPGKDSWRHTQAGSNHVVLVSPDKVAAIRRVDREPSLDEIASTIRDVDVILVEGYKQAAKPKIAVIRAERGTELVCNPEELLAIVSDVELLLGDVPHFKPDDAPGLADLIAARFLSKPASE
jgi:molybdopterin-guanine dinucleotide biosynthesis protein B